MAKTARKTTMNAIVPKSLDLITIEAGASYHKVHPTTVRRWISNGWLTAYRIGPTLLRLDRAEVEALAQAIPTADAR